LADHSGTGRLAGEEGESMSFDTVDMARLRGLAGNKWRRYGEDVLPAWVADMDFLQAAPIREYLMRAASNGDLGYPFAEGPEPLQEVFAERAMKRYGWPVDTGRIELIIDVVQGLYLGMDIYCERGEGVIIPTPIYPNFLSAAAETGRRAIESPLVLDGGRFVIDFDALEACVDDGTRLLMVCNPHNPTGRVFQREELEGLAELALRHDLVVIADEIFADMVYEGGKYTPFASLGPEIAARTVTYHSATKAFNLGGIRIAIAVFGSDKLHERYKAVPRRILGGHNCLGIPLTRIAYQECDDWLAEVVPYLRGNRDFVGEFFARRMPAVGYVPPESTYFAWMNCTDLDLPGGPYEYFLEHAKVALSDGVSFGEVGKGCVRLNYATPRALLEQILERLADSIEK
jgi:cystathionine beta-lyase